jgi:hypothetical protein
MLKYGYFILCCLRLSNCGLISAAHPPTYLHTDEMEVATQMTAGGRHAKGK